MKESKKSKEMEDKIILATLDVIEEKTICETRMLGIAKKAEVYQSNLHYYYKSKKELLMAAQKRVAQRCIELRDEAKEVAEDTLEGQLEVFIIQKITFMTQEQKYDYAEIDFWVQSRFDEDYKAEFKRSFYGWRRELQDLIAYYGPKMAEHEQVLLASIVISLLEGASIQYLIDAEAFSVDAYFKLCKKLVIREILSYA